MPRPPRTEFPGATWHLMARGNRGQFIFERPADNRYFLKLLGETIDLFGWQCLGYCLMSNHYHLVMRTPQPNLSRGMRNLNSRYVQYSNHVHERYGHLFHGRFKSELVEDEAYLATLLQYVALNPVRTELVDHPSQWKWSSWREMCAEPDAATNWFDRDPVLAIFGTDREAGRLTYQKLVLAGLKHGSGQVNELANELEERMRQRSLVQEECLDRQTRLPGVIELSHFKKSYRDPDEGIVAAWETGQYTHQAIAETFNLHRTTVSRLIKRNRVK